MEWWTGLGDPGEGYAATPVATATWTSDTTVGSWIDLTFTGTSAELTALINSFTNPSTNAGLILRSADETSLPLNNMIRFDSSDAATQAYAPQLIVTTVPEPATMAMLGLGGVMMLIRRRNR